MIRILNFSSTIIIIQLLTILAAYPCTTFFMWDNSDGHDRAFLGKNYDWHMGQGMIYLNKRGVKKSPIVLKGMKSNGSTTFWKSRYGSLTFNQYGREFPNGGINEKGLVVEVSILKDSKFPSFVESGKTINELQWVQYQLDNFSSVKEMIDETKNLNIVPYYGKVHYLACDRTRNCAAFEYLNGHWVITTGKKLKLKTLTNSTYEDSITNFSSYRGFGGERNFPVVRPLIHKKDKSIAHFLQASLMASQFHMNDPLNTIEGVDYGFQILKKVAHPLSFTQWQIIYDIDNLGVYFKVRGKKGQKTRYINFGDVLKYLDMSCFAPVMGIDIMSIYQSDNEQKEINITSEFKPYDYEENRKIVLKSIILTSLRRAFVVNKMAELPESFECEI
ncbi:MAG: linear amide C-N hydrolase [Oligoflexia bacterium]|nr:linear amide C-N hydrolase [Oligoflexia bacterium]